MAMSASMAAPRGAGSSRSPSDGSYRQIVLETGAYLGESEDLTTSNR